MSAEKQARERMVQQRLENQHIQETMLNRTEAETQAGGEYLIEEQAREQMTQQRLNKQHLDESMLTRAEAEVTISASDEPNSCVRKS